MSAWRALRNGAKQFPQFPQAFCQSALGLHPVGETAKLRTVSRAEWSGADPKSETGKMRTVSRGEFLQEVSDLSALSAPPSSFSQYRSGGPWRGFPQFPQAIRQSAM